MSEKDFFDTGYVDPPDPDELDSHLNNEGNLEFHSDDVPIRHSHQKKSFRQTLPSVVLSHQEAICSRVMYNHMMKDNCDGSLKFWGIESGLYIFKCTKKARSEKEKDCHKTFFYPVGV